MFKHYGYPSGFCYGCKLKSPVQSNFTPNIIITHNKVTDVNEYIFPILKKAYVKDKMVDATSTTFKVFSSFL